MTFFFFFLTVAPNPDRDHSAGKEGTQSLKDCKKERTRIEGAERGRKKKKNVPHYVLLASATRGSICQITRAELE